MKNENVNIYEIMDTIDIHINAGKKIYYESGKDCYYKGGIDALECLKTVLFDIYTVEVFTDD